MLSISQGRGSETLNCQGRSFSTDFRCFRGNNKSRNTFHFLDRGRPKSFQFSPLRVPVFSIERVAIEHDSHTRVTRLHVAENTAQSRVDRGRSGTKRRRPILRHCLLLDRPGTFPFCYSEHRLVPSCFTWPPVRGQPSPRVR